jgi:hypothetical protein
MIFDIVISPVSAAAAGRPAGDITPEFLAADDTR